MQSEALTWSDRARGDGSATKDRPLARWLPDAALVLAGLVFVPICLVLPWGSDLGLHLAAITRLEHSLTHPGNPVLDVGGSSPYYSPYTVALAVVGKIIGAGPLTLIKTAGIVNLVLILTGMRAFVRTLTSARWAPVLAFVMLMLLWGTHPLAWSGFFSASSTALCVGYPSSFAFGLMLHMWTLTARSTGRGSRISGWWWHALIGALLAIVMISHQFTAIGAVLGIAALLASRWRTLDRPRLARWVLAAVVAVAIVIAWPYYHLWQLGGQIDNLSAVHSALYNYHFYWLAIVALPALLVRFRRDRLDPLVLLAVVAALVVGYGYVTGDYSWGRTMPVLLLPAQVALGIELAQGLGMCQRRALRRAYAVVVGLALLLGAWSQAGMALLYSANPHDGATVHVLGVPVRTELTFGRYNWITRYVKPRQVVLTDDRRALDMISAYGAYSVAESWYDPEVSLAAQQSRAQDVGHFFGPHITTAGAAALLRRYHVQWIITQPELPPPAGLHLQVVARSTTGELLLRVTSAD